MKKHVATREQSTISDIRTDGFNLPVGDSGIGNECFNPTVGDMVNDYLFNDLSREEAALVEDHLLLCLPCVDFVTAVRGVFDQLRKDPGRYFGKERRLKGKKRALSAEAGGSDY